MINNIIFVSHRSAGPQLQAAAQAASDNPPAAAAVATAAIAAPLAAYYAIRYGGYSGDLSPTQTLQLLQVGRVLWHVVGRVDGS